MLTTKTERESIAKRVDLKAIEGRSILITGGTGMVGSYLVETICQVARLQGYSPRELRVTSKARNYSIFQDLSEFNFLTFQVQPDRDVSSLAGFDYLFHLASPASPTQYGSIEELKKINGESLKTLITNETERVVFVSSGEVYGFNAPSPVSENFEGSLDLSVSRVAYPLAKLEAEDIGKKTSSELGVDFRVARLFHTFGPGIRENDGRSFSDFLWQTARGNKITLKSQGSDVRTFLYSEDAVVALINILTHDQNLGPINVGSEIKFSIFEFAQLVSSKSLNNTNLVFNLSNPNYVHSPNHTVVPDVAKLKSIGWSQEVSLDEAIQRTLAWIERQI